MKSERKTICLIDGPINLAVLSALAGRVPKNLTLLNQNTDYVPSGPLPISHGTICMALLIETSLEQGILENVRFIHISIHNSTGQNSLALLLKAFEYCDIIQPDIISMSVGIFDRLYAKKMLPFLNRWRGKTLVFASASNDIRLVYPSAFKTVIGIKGQKKDDFQIQKANNPLDGIDLVVSHRETPILGKVKKQYGLSYKGYNSVLVPQISVIAANQLITRSVKSEKNAVVQSIVTEEAPNTLTICPVNSEKRGTEIPVILISYVPKGKDCRAAFARSLQNEFEKHGYGCAVLCDFLQTSSFEKGWYLLREKRLRTDLVYYLNALSENIFLALLNNENTPDIDFDLNLEDYVERFPPAAVYDMIMTKFT